MKISRLIDNEKIICCSPALFFIYHYKFILVIQEKGVICPKQLHSHSSHQSHNISIRQLSIQPGVQENLLQIIDSIWDINSCY